jgi:hypothetical protein
MRDIMSETKPAVTFGCEEHWGNHWLSELKVWQARCEKCMLRSNTNVDCMKSLEHLAEMHKTLQLKEKGHAERELELLEAAKKKSKFDMKFDLSVEESVKMTWDGVKKLIQSNIRTAAESGYGQVSISFSKTWSPLIRELMTTNGYLIVKEADPALQPGTVLITIGWDPK